MQTRLDLEAFEANVCEFDASVEAEPSIDRFCSGSAWILPFHRAFLPERELHIYRHGDAFVALAGQSRPSTGPYVEALETMWQFACPLAGEGSVELLARVQADIAREHGQENLPLVLAGIPRAGRFVQTLVATLRASHELRVADATQRYVASLAGGFDGFLSRRSSAFRRNLRAAGRRARAAGIEVSHASARDESTALRLYDRILAIERSSWKATAGVGVDTGPMSAFYRDMFPRLALRGRLSVLIAQHEGRDVGYLSGGALGTHFRGLQVSFDASYAHLSLGNLLQREMIGRLCDEGFETYDLGGGTGYKERWSEPGLETVTLVCRPAR